MTEFGNCSEWTLVNKFNIRQDRSDGQKPEIWACVPKGLHIEVTDFEIVHAVSWLNGPGVENPGTITNGSHIQFSATLRDRISVFSPELGELAVFDSLTDALIKPAPKGLVGGKTKASVYDGIDYSGFSQREVPATGLMEGEPGCLYFSNDPKVAPGAPRLSAELYLEEDWLFHTIESISRTTKPIRSFKVYLEAELFESNLSAAYSEGEMSRDLGMLLPGPKADWARTRARLENLAVSLGSHVRRVTDKD